MVRTEALRNPDIWSARVDSEWRGLYRDFAERSILDGELDRKNVRALRTVLGAMVLGIAQHGVEANLADHKECLRGMLLLFRGQLVRPRTP